jgi:hypothetical protein
VSHTTLKLLLGIIIACHTALTSHPRCSLALSRPDAITAIISQNGNAFEEGLGAFWDDIRRYWAKPTAENREAIRWLTSMKATKWQVGLYILMLAACNLVDGLGRPLEQYVTGETNTSEIPPETYTLDQALLDRPGNAEIQLDLFLDCEWPCDSGHFLKP